MKTNWPLRAMPQSYHLFTLLSFCWWYSPMTSPSQSHHLRFQQGWNFESEPFWHLVFHGPCLHDTILWTKRILGTFEFVAGMEWDSRRFKVRKLGKICRGGKFCPNGKKKAFWKHPQPWSFSPTTSTRGSTIVNLHHMPARPTVDPATLPVSWSSLKRFYPKKRSNRLKGGKGVISLPNCFTYLLICFVLFKSLNSF